MADENRKAWVEVTSLGDSYTTKVELVIQDADGDQVRYPIPNCVAVQYEVRAQPNTRNGRQAKCLLELHRVHLKTTTPLSVDGLHVNDLIAEIAAGKLDREDK